MNDEEAIKSSRTNLQEPKENRSDSSSTDDKVRLFLARALISLIFIALLIAYKKDINPLEASPTLGMATYILFKYYFTRDKK